VNLPEPLRNNPIRLRKRRSLHGVLFGNKQPYSIRPMDSVTMYGLPSVPAGSSPKTYMSDFPDEYARHPGSMLTPSNNYQPYDASVNSHIPRPNLPTVPDDFGIAALELAGAGSTEPDVEYEDSLMDEDFFEIQMKLLNKQFDGKPVIPWDNNELATRILQRHNSDEDSEFDQDLRSNMLEIQMAVEQVRAEPLADVNPEPMDFGLTIPQDFFEQQERMFENQFYEIQPSEFDYGGQMEADFSAQEAMFEQPMEEIGPMTDSGQQTLENIVEAEQMQYATGMADDISGIPDLINEGPVEQMYETPEQMEPYPTPLGYDDGMMPQEMYDEPMQDMMDPFMMPGPWGPMPGPGPGGP